MVLKAYKENYIYSLGESYSKTFNYTSGKIESEHKKYFFFGRIEARIKFSNVEGSWAAFWTCGENQCSIYWQYCGEIDIVEPINNNDYYNVVLHYASKNIKGVKPHKQIAKGDCGKGLIDLFKWHTYGMIWNKDRIDFYVDDVNNILYSIDLPDDDKCDAFRKPHYLILNLALGGNYAKLTPNDSDMPMEVKVDYIKVFSNVKNAEYRNEFDKDKKHYYDTNGEIIKNKTFYINKICSR